MATAQQMLEGFDTVQFLLVNYKEMSLFEMSQKLNQKTLKIKKLCRLLNVTPKPEKVYRIRAPYKKRKNAKEDHPVRQESIPNRKPVERPPTTYTNIKTPFGIATEMLEEQEREERALKKKYY